MTAAYRLKGLGWFASCVAIVLGFYLVSLQVASERKKLDDLNGRISTAKRDIRALETEFDTRANLAQLERWNGDTLALVAPVAGQFVRDEAGLAQIDFNAGQPGGPQVQTAAYVVPSMPDASAVVPSVTAAPAIVQVAARDPLPMRKAAVVHPATPAPSFAHAMETARAEAVSRVRPQAVAMLDRKLLSDSTLGDILSGARHEAGGRR